VVPDRNCFAALVFMCRTSTPWALLPANELGCGSATTAWRRLEEWQRAGVFDQLSLVLLDRLGEAGRINLGRVSVDSASLRARKGGRTRRNPCRPRQAREQAAPGRRQRRRRAARRAADRGEQSGRGAGGGIGGRPARDSHALGAPAPPAGQAPRR
jgi:transposase